MTQNVLSVSAQRPLTNLLSRPAVTSSCIEGQIFRKTGGSPEQSWGPVSLSIKRQILKAKDPYRTYLKAPVSPWQKGRTWDRSLLPVTLNSASGQHWWSGLSCSGVWIEKPGLKVRSTFCHGNVKTLLLELKACIFFLPYQVIYCQRATFGRLRLEVLYGFLNNAGSPFRKPFCLVEGVDLLAHIWRKRSVFRCLASSWHPGPLELH